jgi:hypothetical protein
LLRDAELDMLAPERATLAGLAGVPVVCRHYDRLLLKLAKLFHKYGCDAYSGLLGFGPVPSVPYDPGAEFETPALRAAIEWLQLAPGYPLHSTEQEQRQLLELRRCAERKAVVRLRELTGPPDDPTSKPTPQNFLLDREAETILRALASSPSTKFSVRRVARRTHIGEKAVKKHVKKLIELNLAVRPSPKKGVGITSAGKELAKKLPDQN